MHLWDWNTLYHMLLSEATVPQQVALLIRWSSQASRKLPGALSVFLLQAGCLLAMDVTQRTSSSGEMPDLDAEHIARWVLQAAC
jgi:hypothetical protein